MPLVANPLGRTYLASIAVVTGTGLRNDDESSLSRVIHRRCEPGCEVVLRKGRPNRHMSFTVAVYVSVPRLFGLLRPFYAQIGCLDERAAASVPSRIDSGGEVRAWLKNVYATEERDNLWVSLTIC